MAMRGDSRRFMTKTTAAYSDYLLLLIIIVVVNVVIESLQSRMDAVRCDGVLEDPVVSMLKILKEILAENSRHIGQDTDGSGIVRLVSICGCILQL